MNPIYTVLVRDSRFEKEKTKCLYLGESFTEANKMYKEASDDLATKKIKSGEVTVSIGIFESMGSFGRTIR